MSNKPSFVSTLLVTFALPLASAAPNQTGYLPPTAQEKAWADANMIIVTGVRPNSLAMQRVAAEQPKVQGKAAAATATPAKDGAEISGVKGLVAAARVTKSKLTAVSMAYPRAVDNSAEAWFPPIGDQNPLGSCASFCSTRYTMTS